MPRAGLTPERVADEAAVLADEVGLDRVTLAALAARLGVRQPSLYKHIDSLAGLRRSVSIAAKHELGGVLARAAVGLSRGDALRAMAAAYRSWALGHPGRYQAAQHTPSPDDTEEAGAALAVVQVIGDVLTGFALEGDDAIDAIRALRATLHGFVSLEADGAFALPADLDRSFDRAIDGFVSSLARGG